MSLNSSSVKNSVKVVLGICNLYFGLFLLVTYSHKFADKKFAYNEDHLCFKNKRKHQWWSEVKWSFGVFYQLLRIFWNYWNIIWSQALIQNIYKSRKAISFELRFKKHFVSDKDLVIVSEKIRFRIRIKLQICSITNCSKYENSSLKCGQILSIKNGLKALLIWNTWLNILFQ